MSGIIPDLFTDIVINPAYMVFAEGVSINYGYRSVSEVALPFRYLSEDYELKSQMTPYKDTNELTVYGFETLGWRWAIATEWQFLQSDDTRPSFEHRVYSWSNYEYSDIYRTLCYHNNTEYWRIELAGAHTLGDEAAIGIRIGADEYYRNDWNRNRYYTERYRYSDFLEKVVLNLSETRDDFATQSSRWLSYYLKLGLLFGTKMEEANEIVLQVSHDPVFSRHHSYSLDINENRNQLGEVSGYSYYLSEWRDSRGGDLWSFSLSGRYMFPRGIRGYIGTIFETCDYDTDWFNLMQHYRWELDTRYNIDLSTLKGTGASRNVTFFAKAGKTIEINELIDVTTGVRGRFQRYWFEEDPSVRYSQTLITDEFRDDSSLESQIRFKSEYTHARLQLPVAIEFRPSGYFSLFCGITANLLWTRETETYFIPDFWLEPSDARIPGGVTAGGGHSLADPLQNTNGLTYTDDYVNSSYGATFGFSLHYNDRLFVECYTGSDITPDKLTYYVLDLRYSF
ncbi:MAG: hypothetical protein JSV33_00215 [bacterium]|nr:MAG: hypothetical protein JSV33_00215 [bacterium]